MSINLNKVGSPSSITSTSVNNQNNHMPRQSSEDDSVNIAAPKGIFAGFEQRLSLFDRIFRPYIKIENGYLSFTTRDTKKIAKGLEKLELAYMEPSGKLTKEELATFNRMLNLVDERFDIPVYRSCFAKLVEIIRNADKDILELSIQRKQDVSTVNGKNKEFFIEIASAKEEETGEYKYKWDICCEAAKCAPKNTENFKKLLAFLGEIEQPIMQTETVVELAKSEKATDLAIDLAKKLLARYKDWCPTIVVNSFMKPGVRSWDDHYAVVTQYMQDKELDINALYSVVRSKTLSAEKIDAIKDLSKRQLLESEAYCEMFGLGSGFVGQRLTLDEYMTWDRMARKRDTAKNYICGGLKISSDEYDEIYKYYTKIGNLTQMKDFVFKDGKPLPMKRLPSAEEIKHGNLRVITAGRIKSAIKQYNDSLLQEKGGNNEILLVKPRVKGLVAMVNTIDDVDKEIKEYAQKYNLPIIILGKQKDYKDS